MTAACPPRRRADSDSGEVKHPVAALRPHRWAAWWSDDPSRIPAVDALSQEGRAVARAGSEAPGFSGSSA
jgi:hypothetical protein